MALLASSVLWLSTVALALQAWLQVGNVWLLYAIVAVQSGAQAINQPARSAIIAVLVRKELLPAANALNMMTFGLTMTAGLACFPCSRASASLAPGPTSG